MKKIPQHIAIICDGNRRWAKQKNLPTFLGHLAGMKNIKQLVQHLKKSGVKVVTLYVFSTENWSRTKEEVAYLMNLFIKFYQRNFKKIIAENTKFIVLGDPDGLPQKLKQLLLNLQQETNLNDDFVLQIAINYGGRDEIVRAFKRMVAKLGSLKDISVEKFSQFLDTAGVPDPDLIIRTSGEQRLSNFLLWQSAYSEIYFAPEFLPDFDIVKLDQVLDWFAVRQRRFGK